MKLDLSVTADEIPTFRIGVELFQSGLNQIEIIVSHDVCGRASLNLRFHLPEPVGGIYTHVHAICYLFTYGFLFFTVCRISCNYRVVNSSLEFKCDVNNGGSFRSAGYTINGPPPYSVDIPRKIILYHRVHSVYHKNSRCNSYGLSDSSQPIHRRKEKYTHTTL